MRLIIKEMPIVAKILQRVSQVILTIKQENPQTSLFRLFSWLKYILEGKVLAFLCGWRKSYLGLGSRVIGSRFIKVGENVSIGRYSWIEAVISYQCQSFKPTIIISNGFHASERLHISAINHIQIGENCLFGTCVYISDHNHGSYRGDIQSHPNEPPLMRKLVSHGQVIIGSNVWIGDNVTIVGPVRVGNGVVIGANSVVTRDIPDYVIVAGVPAKIIKRFNLGIAKWESVENL